MTTSTALGISLTWIANAAYIISFGGAALALSGCATLTTSGVASSPWN